MGTPSSLCRVLGTQRLRILCPSTRPLPHSALARSLARSSSNHHIFIITGHSGCHSGQKSHFSLMGGAVSLRSRQHSEGEIHTCSVAQGEARLGANGVLHPALDSASPAQGLVHAPLPGEIKLFNSNAFSLCSHLVLPSGCLTQTSLMPGSLAVVCPPSPHAPRAPNSYIRN